MITNGAPGSVTPATSRSAATTWASYQIAGISTCRCGSLASSGRPVAVRMPDSTQLLLPPARAVMSSHSRPGGSGGVSSRALAEASGRCGHGRDGGRAMAHRVEDRGRARRKAAEQQVGFGAPTRARQPAANQLAAPVLREAPGQQPRDGQGVHRRPRLRRQPEQEEFRRPPPAPHRRDRRVDARRIVFHPAADVWCGSLPLPCGSPPQSHCQESFVGPHRDRAEHLGQPPASGAPVDFHLPQPFPAMQEAEGGPRVIGIARVDMGHGLRVEEDLHGRGQPRAGEAALRAAARFGGGRASRPPRPTGAAPASERAGRSASGGGGWAFASVGQLAARKVHGRIGEGTGGLSSPCRVGNGSSRIGCWREHVAPGLQLTRSSYDRRIGAASAPHG